MLLAMLQLTRSTEETLVDAPRDASIASVWRDLNRAALVGGVWLGPITGVLYVIGWQVTSHIAYLWMLAVAIGITVTCARRLLAGRYNSEALLLFGAIGSAIAVALVPPVVRGALSAATIVIAMAGVLVLPERVRTRFTVVVVLFTLDPLAWPLLGITSYSDALGTLVVTVPSLVFGLLAVGMGRRALEQSERRRLEIFRRVPFGLFRTAPHGRVVDANAAFAAMLGYDDSSEVVDRDIADMHESPQEWLDLLADISTTDDPVRFAYRMRTRDGAAIWVRGSAQAIRGDDGEIIYLEGATEDVTQRRKVEEWARHNEERFRNVFEGAPIALWEEDFSAAGARIEQLREEGVTDLRAHLASHPDETQQLIELIDFIDVNAAGIELVGAQTKEEAIRGLASPTLPDDVVAGFVEEFVAIWEDRDSVTIETRGTTFSGGSTDLALSWAASRTPNGDLDLTRVIVAIQDIAMIRQAERDLAALLKSKDDLVASVSHELRTPITAILGMAHELKDRADTFTEDESEELISIIADQSRELSNIVDDLLVAAWSDRDALAVRSEVVNITAEVPKIVGSNQQGPTVRIDRTVLAWTDPLRFRQILRNLLTNADKYGGPNVSISARTDGGVIRLLVSDDGPGVPPDHRDRIFDPYHRSRAERGVPGSLGLGLPVSRRLARLMGGDLTYRYEDGSVFELQLPAPVRGHFL